MRKTIKQHSVALIAILVSMVLGTGSPNFAQSVADAARQERERRHQLALHATHVYTNEDLAKPRILVPEDEARVAARQKDTTPSESALDAQASPPQAAPAVAAEPIEIPDIKDAVSAPELPEVAIASSAVLLPADVAKTAPPVVNHYPQRDISAPAVAGQTPYDPLAALPSPDQNSASILIPASASKPLAKQASNSKATQRPTAIGEISLPSTTMPFSNVLGYVPNIALSVAATTSTPLPREAGNRVQNQPPSAEVKMPTAAMPFAAAMAEGATYPGVPVPVTPSAAKMAVKTAAVPLSAPAVASGVADAPVWLSVTEPSIVRPAAENVKAVDPENCAADCGSKVGTVAPAELPIGTSIRPEAADTTNNPPVAFIPNRNQAIVETVGKVRVVPGDSLWRLAARYLGNGLRWRQLAALNPQLVNPNHIQVGDWIQIPSEPKQTAKHVIIQPGDTLWRVARTTLGSSLALSCLVHANPKIRSVDQVLAGETLVVPSTCSNLESTQN